MAIYSFLSARFPGPVARIVTAMWFALLLTLVLFCAFEPQAAFRYGKI